MCTISGARSLPSAGERRRQSCHCRGSSWNSLQNTPNVSDYPSTQSTFEWGSSGDARRCPRHRSGCLHDHQWTAFADIKRSFTSFSQAARESADSRMYAGIHFLRPARTGSPWGARLASGPWHSTFSRSRSNDRIMCCRAAVFQHVARRSATGHTCEVSTGVPTA